MNYKQEIINKSNAWYNDGLRKAKIRDLSGATLSLRRSLQYYQGNINARNLLGLVYYGRGEVSDALVEWIISKNFKTDDNPANYFIKKIQSTPDKLEVVNQAIKMYNQSLIICQQDGDDMAIIQLKKAVADHPNLLKAWQLLALLYMHTEQYVKARQALVKARKIDTVNETTMRYIHAMSGIGRSASRRVRKKRPNTVEINSGNETIIQPRARAMVKEVTKRVLIMNILLGIAVGATIVWYLIVPAVNQDRYERANQQMIEYSHRIQSLESQVSAQTRVLDEYRTLHGAIDAQSYQGAGIQESFERLILVQEQVNSGNFTSEVMSENLLAVNRSLLGEQGQSLYDDLAARVFPVVLSERFAAGIESLNVGNNLGAIEQLSRVVMMDEEFYGGYALLRLGNAYENAGNTEGAIASYRRIIELFPYGEVTNQARERIDNLNESNNAENSEDEEQ
jgi:tetratricopeptide (TPR) repeat protein